MVVPLDSRNSSSVIVAAEGLHLSRGLYSSPLHVLLSFVLTPLCRLLREHPKLLGALTYTGGDQSEIRKYRDVYRLYEFPRRPNASNDPMVPRRKDPSARIVPKEAKEPLVDSMP